MNFCVFFERTVVRGQENGENIYGTSMHPAANQPFRYLPN